MPPLRGFGPSRGARFQACRFVLDIDPEYVLPEIALRSGGFYWIAFSCEMVFCNTKGGLSAAQ
jgi:hypothetical protein